jgi:hypothetical protein
MVPPDFQPPLPKFFQHGRKSIRADLAFANPENKAIRLEVLAHQAFYAEMDLADSPRNRRKADYQFLFALLPGDTGRSACQYRNMAGIIPKTVVQITLELFQQRGHDICRFFPQIAAASSTCAAGNGCGAMQDKSEGSFTMENGMCLWESNAVS